MLTFTQSQLKQAFNPRYFSRGLQCFKYDQVFDLHIEESSPEHLIITSSCLGSENNAYEQYIRIFKRQNRLILQGECSCPVGSNCKHIVAACLTYLDQQKESGPDISCQQWLDKFIAAGEEELDASEVGELVHYLLDHTENSGELTVTLIQTRAKKTGDGFTKGRKLGLDELRYQFRRFPTIDKEISALLTACPTKAYYGPPILKDKIGFLAINHILSTGRCFWQSNQNPPLQALEDHSLTLEWKKDAQGNATLQGQISKGGELILTQPPIYLDTQRHGLGNISDCPFNMAQLEQLLKPVTVPKAELHSFSQRLATFSDAPLAPPQKVNIHTIQNVEPTPGLYLRGMDDNGRTIHCMDLNFYYEETLVPAYPEYPIHTIEEGGELIKVHRDLESEYTAIAHLQELGFEGLIHGENSPGLFFVSLSKHGIIEGALRWQQFLEEEIPQLEQTGWWIEIDDSFLLQFDHADDAWDVEIEEHNEWFDLSFDITINGEKRPLLPLVSSILAQYDSHNLPEQIIVETAPHHYTTLSSEPLKPVIDTLYELYDNSSLSKDGTLRLARYDAARLQQLEQTTNAKWLGGKALRDLGKKLNNFTGIKNITPPKALNAELREYQQHGLNWLQFLREYQFNGILADDMGLGKTVQTLAHLQYEKQCRRLTQPCLIIAPTSLVSNWRREAEKFTPRLKVLVLHGADRKTLFNKINDHDIIITTYPLLVRDADELQQHHYHYLILDEAQVIKNPKAKASQRVRELNSNHRLCLTGTPMENHLGELWSLFDFLMPGFLGDERQFKQLFRTPIEQHQDTERQQRLSQRIAPFMLRRTKSSVAHELPEKTEIIRSVPLDDKQAALYESIRISMEKKVQQAIQQKGLARSHITILDALLKLRQCCCDPSLLSLKQAQAVNYSAKLEMLMEMVPELLEEGRRILLFSQFTQMLSIIEKRLKELNINYTKLTGQTRKRDAAIQSFKDGEANIFLISLKAGGVGLNLTEADTVIHYDPWWNPATENQATDRAHRIGQDKAVFVYKLITENTLEEKILAMQAKKQALADGVYRDKSNTENETTFSQEDLQSLFAPLN